MMELLVELASTIAITLLLCHFLIKLFSPSPASFATVLGDGQTGHVRDFAVRSVIVGSAIENRVAIVEEEDVEEQNHSTDEKYVERVKVVEEAMEILDESLAVVGELNRCADELLKQEIPGGEEDRTDDEIVERTEFAERVREIVDESLDAEERLESYAEKLEEQEIPVENGGRCLPQEEQGNQESAREAVRENENHCTDEKIVERMERVREIVDESLEAVERLGRYAENLVEQEISGNNGGCFSVGEIEECLGEDEDDDWVGVERTELEKLFGSAMAFVGSAGNEARVSGLDNDAKAKLYGLRKIATQGPCSEPQPMALKLSARAKWNAWQELGKMTPEIAMEQYVSLVSKSVPNWCTMNS